MRATTLGPATTATSVSTTAGPVTTVTNTSTVTRTNSTTPTWAYGTMIVLLAIRLAIGYAVQIANQATIGGDVLQEVWCWYLRNNFDCWRNGGNVCYAA
ncbi:MAG: hypothetical protein ABSG45_04500, partial [Nitrososphaerales archaeon]